MNSIVITSDLEKKSGRIVIGKIAVGERVSVTLKNMASYKDGGVRIRVLHCGETIAVYPTKEDTEAPPREGLWAGAKGDPDDLVSTLPLNLYTVQALQIFEGCGDPLATADCSVVVDTVKDNVEQLFFAFPTSIRNWVLVEGMDQPYDLSEYPDIIESFRGEIKELEALNEKWRTGVEADLNAFEQGMGDQFQLHKDTVTQALADMNSTIGTKASQEDLASGLAEKANKKDVASSLNLKADKTAVASALDTKANKEDVYTKNDINAKLSLKANESSVYSKSEVDKKLTGKAEVSDLTQYQKTLTFDSTPTSGSQNPVTSDGVCRSLGLKADKTYVDGEIGKKQDTIKEGDNLPNVTIGGKAVPDAGDVVTREGETAVGDNFRLVSGSSGQGARGLTINADIYSPKIEVKGDVSTADDYFSGHTYLSPEGLAVGKASEDGTMDPNYTTSLRVGIEGITVVAPHPDPDSFEAQDYPYVRAVFAFPTDKMKGFSPSIFAQLDKVTLAVKDDLYYQYHSVFFHEEVAVLPPRRMLILEKGEGGDRLLQIRLDMSTAVPNDGAVLDWLVYGTNISSFELVAVKPDDDPFGPPGPPALVPIDGAKFILDKSFVDMEPEKTYMVSITTIGGSVSNNNPELWVTAKEVLNATGA